MIGHTFLTPFSPGLGLIMNKICLITSYEVGSKPWRLQPVCNCYVCTEYFFKLRTHQIEIPPWVTTPAGKKND